MSHSDTSETADRTTHPKILVARHMPLDDARFVARLEELRRAVAGGDEPATRRLLGELVPELRSARRNILPFPVEKIA